MACFLRTRSLNVLVTSLSFAPVLARSLAVVTGDEEIDDREEILGELVPVGTCTAVCAVVNHETHSMALEDGLEKVEGKAAEPVSVGNHNLVDSSLEDEFQKRLQAPSLEVEPRANVGEDLVPWVGLAEVFDLALEVRLLMGRADAGVDDLGLFVLGLTLPAAVSKEEGDIGLVVQPLPSGELGEADFAIEGPFAEAGGGYGIFLLNALRRDVHTVLEEGLSVEEESCQTLATKIKKGMSH